MLALALMFLFAPPVQSDLAAKAQKAQEAMSAGRYREAVVLCRELVKAVPGNARLLMNLGVAQQMAGEPDAAVENLRAATKLDPELFAANLYLGMAQMSVGRPQLAIEPFRKALELKPQSAQLQEALGDALFAADHFEEAAEQLEHATSAEPKSASAWYTLGRSWLALERQTNAELLEETAQDSVYALSVKANGLLRRGQARRAFAVFQNVLARNGDMVDARLAIAKIYREDGHVNWAEQEKAGIEGLDCATHILACEFAQGKYRAVVAATNDKHTPDELYWRGAAFSGLSDEAFGKLEQLPPSKELYLYRAGVEYDMGHPGQAVAALRTARELAPQDRAVQVQLAMALGAARDFDAAYKLACELLRGDPKSAELNALAGDALLNQQEPERAIPFLLKSLAADGNNVITHQSLGLAYMQTGQPKLAIPHLLAAARTDSDGSVNFQLANAYRQTAQPELAKAAMTRYRELSTKSAVPPEPEITPPQ